MIDLTRRDVVMAAGGIAALALPGSTACARQPQGRTLGYAVVGLGGYGLGRIVPEFANCAHSRLTGLVSGDRANAARVAAVHGLPTRNIYDYANFDSIADNPDIHIVYISLPTSMHAEYKIGRAQVRTPITNAHIV